MNLVQTLNCFFTWVPQALRRSAPGIAGRGRAAGLATGGAQGAARGASRVASGVLAGVRAQRGPLLGLLLGMMTSPSALAHAFDQAEIRQPRASFVDVSALRPVLRARPGGAVLGWTPPPAGDCTATAPLPAPASPMVIPGRYVSGGHGAVRPDFDAAVALYRDVSRSVWPAWPTSV